MKLYRAALRRHQAVQVASRSARSTARAFTRRVSNGPRYQREQKRGQQQQQQQERGPRKLIGLLFGFGLSAGAVYYYPILFPGTDLPQSDEVRIPQAQIKYEKERKAAASKEENRDLISSQHLQVKQSWERPGVWAWGSNSGKVIDQNSNDSNVKVPRRIPYFDDQILRDIKLTHDFGVAVTEKGNLVQWGLGFSQGDPSPVETLKDKDITKIAISNDRVLALASNGTVYGVPVSRGDQETDGKASPVKASSSSSWIPFWSSGNEVLPTASIRNLTPGNLGWGEKISDISSGLHHCLYLSSKGRVFSAASSTSQFPSQGQMGIPGLGWATRPAGAFDQPHEILSLKGSDITQVATGDYHSVVLDKEGKIFAFGDNTYGQLGLPNEGGFKSLDVPAMIPVARLYTNTGLMPKVTSIAAGGQNTFFTVDANQPDNQVAAAEANGALAGPARRMPRITSDTWACGSGIYGALGTGKWTHVSTQPNKVPALSGLFEFDEQTNRNVPIRLARITVGATHASATMNNETRVGTSSRGSENDTNWGADVLFWGGNGSYQLGTGKRNNLNAPTYIGALDGGPVSGFHRLQLTPRKTVRLGEDGKGRKATLEQKVECGRNVTCVYSSA